MTTQDISLLGALGSKMQYLAERQRVISQNVANADMPGYRSRDLLPVSFESSLKSVTKSGIISTARTDSKHMVPVDEQVSDPKNRKQKLMYEVSPGGNGVILEEQMVKAAQTTMDYNLMTSLYQKNVGLLKTALGR